MKKMMWVVGFFTTLFLSGCMNMNAENYQYKVFTLQDVEAELYGMMQEAGVAEEIEGQPGKLRIKDLQQAKSEVSMARWLNKQGREGWELTAINNSQLYIFQRDSESKTSWEYKVVTLAELDKLIFDKLVVDKAAEPIAEQAGKYKILDVEKAKSQNIMPVILNQLAADRWLLSGINKANLYFFRRQGEGKSGFDKVASENKPKATAATETSSVKKAEKTEAKQTASTKVSDKAGADAKESAKETQPEAKKEAAKSE